MGEQTMAYLECDLSSEVLRKETVKYAAFITCSSFFSYICNVVGTMYVLLSYGFVDCQNLDQAISLCVGVTLIVGIRSSINTLLFFGVIKGNEIWVKIWIVLCVLEACQIAMMLPFLVGQLCQVVEPNDLYSILYWLLAGCCFLDFVLHIYHYWMVHRYILSYMDIIRHLEDQAPQEADFVNGQIYCPGAGE